MEETMYHQFHNNAVAIISLTIAITALFYNTWRNEQTEANRNIRVASFEIIHNLGELQQTVNMIHYHNDNSKINPLAGWGNIALIGDLGQILPPPIPVKTENLISTWQTNWKDIPSNEQSADKVSADIDETRKAVLDVIKHLK